MVGVDFQDGDVGFGIAADDCGGEFTLVMHGDFYVGGAVDYVIVGEDVAVGANDDARAEALLFFLLGLLSLRVWLAVAKKLAEEWVVEHGIGLVIGMTNGARRSNVDNFGQRLLDQRRVGRDRRSRHRGIRRRSSKDGSGKLRT